MPSCCRVQKASKAHNGLDWKVQLSDLGFLLAHRPDCEWVFNDGITQQAGADQKDES